MAFPPTKSWPNKAASYTAKLSPNFNSDYFAKYDFLGDNTIDGVIMKDGSDTTVKPRIDMPVYKHTLEVTRDFFKKGLINKDAATTQLSASDALKKGNVFMIPSPLKPGKDTEMANSTNLPGKLKQVTMNIPTTSTGETSGSMLGISKEPTTAAAAR